MQEIIRKIEEIIEEAERMKNSYFWNPPSGANLRRKYEDKHSHEKVSWTENGHDYTASYLVDCSSRYIFARGNYYRDDKKTNLTAIRNSLARLKKQYSTEE